MEMTTERKTLIDRFQGLRVTDVCDAMDAVGMQDVGLMDAQIGPLWRDVEAFKHRIYGVAHTIRFRPTRRKAPAFDSYEAFKDWRGQWYRELAQGPLKDQVKPGDVIVIDAQGVSETGFIGSCNSLQWLSMGALGIVTNGGARDTDEIIRQEVPVYCRKVSRGIRPGRLELDVTMQPITCGDVRVEPGDVVVADGDGVIVVPRDRAERVAEIATDIQEGDKKGRRWFFNELGREHDFTTEARPDASA